MQRQIVARTASRWVLGAVLALLPLAGHSLGLGKLQLKSSLNEPLNAEIDITSIADNELKGLNVSLAPRADFEAAGAERLPLLSQIKFTVARRPDGRYYLQLKTDAPIEEPFLHVLLQLEWPGGRLVREYTALIDPPSYVASKPATVESPETAPAVAEPAKSPFVDTVPPPTPSGESADTRLAAPASPIPEPLAARTPEVQPEPQPSAAAELQPSEQPRQVPIPPPAEQAREEPAPPATPPIQPAGDPATNWANTYEYTVRPGDTLWGIAERVRADKQLTLEQVILAIFRNNPDAFFRDNVNNLRAGKVLTIPERDAVDAMPVSEARREFRAQYDAWQEYKLKLAAGSRTLKVADAETTTAPPAPTPKADAKPAETQAKPAPSDELLKIVRSAPEAEKSTAGDKAQTESAKSVEAREQTALAERVTTLEESLESKQMENRELTEKVGQVRAQIKNEKRLIEIENQALAQQTAKPVPPTATTEAAKPEPVKPDVKAETPPAPKVEQPVAATPAQPAKPAPRKPLVAPPPPPQESFFESLLSSVTGIVDETVLPIVGGVVALLGGAILMVYFRRRRRSIAEFEESILASDAIATDAVATSSETTGQATTGDTSFLSDFSKGGMGQVHTDEVDPVAEAEVYLAYGRDETAEEILREAIVKNPERHELKQKLLDIYHQRNDVNAFETLAEELYAALGGRGGKIWEKVEEMGRKLNPDNPMFRGGAPERRAAEKASMPATTPAVARQNAAAEENFAVGGMAMAGAATQVVERGSVEFDFDTAPAAAPAEPSLDFDLNTADLSADAAPARAGGDDLASLDFGNPVDNLVDFSSSKDNASGEGSLELDSAPAAAAEDEIKWEVDTPVTATAASEAADAGTAAEDAGNGHWDETATKLDLAKAYIDMGDAEGARSILDEVLAEGNDSQKKQAAELAAQIA